MSNNVEEVPEKLYFFPWPYITKQLASECNFTAQIEQ
jgi:hypothetical protein